MTRRICPDGLRRLPVTVLLASLLLSGCMSQQTTGKVTPSPDSESAAQAYTRLGIAYLERNNLSRAMASLDRALKIDPRDAEALQAMALVYKRQGEASLADELFRKALAADSEMTRARNNYAAFLYEEGRIREACKQLERASRDTKYPNRAQLFSNLGQCQRRLGDIEEARESLARAQNIDPRRADSYLLLARLEYGQGNYAEAERQLDRYIRLAGSDDAARSLAREILRANGAAP
ncbi:MAG TPA: type IV pilus biogenesis/stability protein PilW [Halomonas sp.]|nr:type IV pilus biogenesis/stability protein PilW [Halomonas sp.]